MCVFTLTLYADGFPRPCPISWGLPTEDLSASDLHIMSQGRAWKSVLKCATYLIMVCTPTRAPMWWWWSTISSCFVLLCCAYLTQMTKSLIFLLVFTLFQKEDTSSLVAATSEVDGASKIREIMVELRLCRIVALIRLGMNASKTAKNTLHSHYSFKLT